MKKKGILLIIGWLLVIQNIHTVLAAEPQLVDYTNPPIFMSNVVTPNILIMLDNSGSMNFNAYGTYPGDGGLVADSPVTISDNLKLDMPRPFQEFFHVDRVVAESSARFRFRQVDRVY